MSWLANLDVSVIISRPTFLQDLLLIVLAACGFGVAGILSAIAAKNWSDDVLDRVPSTLPLIGTLANNIVGIRNDIVDIRNGIAAAAVS